MSEQFTEAFAPIPPKVAGAISKVMGAVPKLQKGEKNSHGNYNFASIDDFLEAVRPLCAEHGLIILQDEVAHEMRQGVDKFGKPRNWLMMTFQFTLAHSSGETWAKRPTRTIMVDASMGSQAFGAAQSYALKQFERSLFQIATGEKGVDADAHPPADLPDNQRNGNGRKPRERMADISARKNSRTQFHESVLQDLQDIHTEAQLDRWVADVYEPNKSNLSVGHISTIDEHVEAKRKELSEPVEDDPDPEDIERKILAQEALRDQLVEQIDKMKTADDLLALKATQGFKDAYRSLPAPMQVTVSNYGKGKLKTLPVMEAV